MLLGVWTEPKQVVKKAKRGGDNVFFHENAPGVLKHTWYEATSLLLLLDSWTSLCITREKSLSLFKLRIINIYIYKCVTYLPYTTLCSLSLAVITVNMLCCIFTMSKVFVLSKQRSFNVFYFYNVALGVM